MRHPVSRFWSGYTDKLLRPSAVARHFNVPPRSGFPPETLLDYVRNTSPLELDEHIRPQWACTGVEKLPIDFVGRVETMKEDVERLRDLAFFDRGHVARFRHLNRKERRDFPDRARIDRIIREVYDKDMALFGYD